MEDKDIEKIIKNAGLKNTKERFLVLKTLINKHSPVSIDLLKKIVGKKVDKVSLYRILKIFTEKNIVYKTNLNDNKSFFEYQENHHHHIICTTCGKTEEIKLCIMEDISKYLKQAKNFSKIARHSLEFFGTCKICQKN